MRGWRTPTISARYATSWAAPSQCGNRRARPTWKNSACVSSKAMASPRRRRCWRSIRRCSTSSEPWGASCRGWIGGEMVSLAAVEALAGDLWPNVPSAVVAVPDPRKGERLILVTQQKDAIRSAFLAFARERGASELMIPSEIFNIDKMPLLGSGKVDLVSLNKLVREQVAERSAVAV